MTTYCKLISSGSYLPERIITNNDLSQIINTSNDWIVSRTGIKQRHIASDNECTSDLAYKALNNALESNNIDKDSLDGIIVATTTPDQIFPATAALVQAKLDLNKCFAFDINAVCSGFVYALIIANGLIKSGTAKRIAIIGADTMSKIVDWSDRSTCVLFGDGAGCFIMEGSEDKTGILSSCFYNDGSLGEMLNAKGGLSSGNFNKKLFMNGREVFKHAVEKMASSIIEVIEKADLNINEITWILPHQANQRIFSSVGDKLKLPIERVISMVATHANTSAASIPLAFDSYYKDKKFRENDVIALTAAGAGFSWGALVLKL